MEQLSYFIRKDSLNVDQLTIGGNLILYNLELKLDVLRETLGVPLTFDISRGCIKKLSVTIPWTNLFGQPIELLIDTILIVIRSKTEAEMKHTAHTTCQTIPINLLTHTNPNIPSIEIRLSIITVEKIYLRRHFCSKNSKSSIL